MGTSIPSRVGRGSMAKKLVIFSAALSALTVLTGMMCDNGGGGGNNDPCAITNQPTAGTPLIQAGEARLGSDAALVTVTEYSDPQCPFCASFAVNTFPTLKTNFIDSNKVRWVHRHFPLDNIHLNARIASEACDCVLSQANSTKYFEYLDAIFANRVAILEPAGYTLNPPNPQQATVIANLKALASQQSLNTTDFNTCFDNNTTDNAVEADFDSGVALGVTGTPTFYISYVKNGQTITRRVAGAVALDCFTTLLNTAYTEAGGT